MAHRYTDPVPFRTLGADWADRVHAAWRQARENADELWDRYPTAREYVESVAREWDAAHLLTPAEVDCLEEGYDEIAAALSYGKYAAAQYAAADIVDDVLSDHTAWTVARLVDLLQNVHPETPVVMWDGATWRHPTVTRPDTVRGADDGFTAVSFYPGAEMDYRESCDRDAADHAPWRYAIVDDSDPADVTVAASTPRYDLERDARRVRIAIDALYGRHNATGGIWPDGRDELVACAELLDIDLSHADIDATLDRAIDVAYELRSMATAHDDSMDKAADKVLAMALRQYQERTAR